MNPQDPQNPQGNQTPPNASGTDGQQPQQPPPVGQAPPQGVTQNPAPNPNTPPVTPAQGMQQPTPKKSSKTGMWLLVAVIVALAAASYLIVTAL